MGLRGRICHRGGRGDSRVVEVGSVSVPCRALHLDLLDAWLLAWESRADKVHFDAFPTMPVVLSSSILAALGSALFAPGVLSGGSSSSASRSAIVHAVVAAIGAFVANVLALQAGVAGGAINFGFVGFNGVLAALAAYVIVAADLRLVVLASVLATWLASYVYRGASGSGARLGVRPAVWTMLLLGWLNPRFAAKPSEPKPVLSPEFGGSVQFSDP